MKKGRTRGPRNKRFLQDLPDTRDGSVQAHPRHQAKRPARQTSDLHSISRRLADPDPADPPSGPAARPGAAHQPAEVPDRPDHIPSDQRAPDPAPTLRLPVASTSSNPFTSVCATVSCTSGSTREHPAQARLALVRKQQRITRTSTPHAAPRVPLTHSDVRTQIHATGWNFAAFDLSTPQRRDAHATLRKCKQNSFAREQVAQKPPAVACPRRAAMATGACSKVVVGRPVATQCPKKAPDRWWLGRARHGPQAGRVGSSKHLRRRVPAAPLQLPTTSPFFVPRTRLECSNFVSSLEAHAPSRRRSPQSPAPMPAPPSPADPDDPPSPRSVTPLEPQLCLRWPSPEGRVLTTPHPTAAPSAPRALANAGTSPAWSTSMSPDPGPPASIQLQPPQPPSQAPSAPDADAAA